jgi:hypothetical protein
MCVIVIDRGLKGPTSNQIRGTLGNGRLEGEIDKQRMTANDRDNNRIRRGAGM